MRITVTDIRNSRIPKVLGVCRTDARIVEFLNEAVQRLLTKGHWWGSFGRFRICATDGCITLPPQIAALERAYACGSPIRVHDTWWEFLENGYGPQSSESSSSSGSGCNSGGCGPDEATQRGNYPTFNDIRGTDKKVLLVCDLDSDVGKEVLVLGYDENNNWIRTDHEDNGIIQDGEIIVLSQAPGTQSDYKFSTITDIQFNTDRDGQVWLYEYNTTDTTQRLIGSYLYFETRPAYARYYFPGFRAPSGDNGCTQGAIDVIAKLEFIPVKNDTDYVLIGNIPALKTMMRAIFLAENEPDGEKAENIIARGELSALRELDNELNHYRGSIQPGVDMMGSSVGFAQPVEALL